MCILGNMHGCFYGLWSKNNKYRVTIELVQKNSLHKKKSGKSARTPITIPKHEPIKKVYVEMVRQIVESEAENDEDAE